MYDVVYRVLLLLSSLWDVGNFFVYVLVISETFGSVCVYVRMLCYEAYIPEGNRHRFASVNSAPLLSLYLNIKNGVRSLF